MKSFMTDDNLSLLNGTLYNEAGTPLFQSSLRSKQGEVALLALENVEEREAAQRLRGTLLYLPRTILPQLDAEEGYYIVDLIGCSSYDASGLLNGTITHVLNFGAGDIVEIQHTDGQTVLYPFTDAIFPEVDIQGRRVTLIPPEIV